MKRKNPEEILDQKIDSSMLALTLILILIGLIMLFTASYPLAYSETGNPYAYVGKQALWAVIGVFGMMVLTYGDYKYLHLIAVPIYIVSVLLLVAVDFVGIEVNHAQRWLRIAGVQFQPSEIVKTAVIILFSSLCVRRAKYIKEIKKGLIPYLALIALIAFFTLRQPHLSATVIIAVTGIVIIFVAGARIGPLICTGLIGLVSAGVFILIKGYAMTRLKVWIDPFVDFTGKGWQGSQSFITIGSGGLFGVGFGQSRQKHLYLPEPSNDFIFPVICEELGFVGAMIIIILFTLFVFRGFEIAAHARDKFGMLLAVGITTKVAVQTIINLFVVTGVMPITGASLPFFSSGGTALLVQILEVGILLNVSKHGRTIS